MNRTIIELTVRQVLGQRRTLLMGVGAALPVLLGVIFAINAPGDDPTPTEFAATGLLAGLVAYAVLPIVALVFGTAVMGVEIEEGTAVYLLSKPIARARIVFSKLLVAWVSTVVLVVPAAVVAAIIAMEGRDPHGVSAAFAVALTAGALGYTALFLLLSLLTSRALIVGLLYVFIWEGVITSLFSGTRVLAIREITLAIADALTTTTRAEFHADVGTGAGVVMMAAFIVAAAALAVRRLERFEIGETV